MLYFFKSLDKSEFQDNSIIAECLSARELILHCISFCCISVTLRNANSVHMVRMCNCISSGGMHSKLWPIVGMYTVMQHAKIILARVCV